jgi:hypothetical protein
MKHNTLGILPLIISSKGSRILKVSIGLVADYFIGGVNGCLIGLVLEWRGTKYYWLKVIGIGLSNWMGLGIMTQLVLQLFSYQLIPLNFFTYRLIIVYLALLPPI